MALRDWIQKSEIPEIPPAKIAKFAKIPEKKVQNHCCPKQEKVKN